jgi:glycosyltransferase involved in cell wall biosynthesis
VEFIVLVTAVMASYNHEKYIAQAIESVLNQTFTDLELVIVDDCSTDASPDIIKKYSEKDPV